MPTIIQHKPSGSHYILLGAGYGQWATARANRILGDLLPSDQKGDQHLLCISDAAGEIFWVTHSDIQVVSIDNQSPSHALAAFQ